LEHGGIDPYILSTRWSYVVSFISLGSLVPIEGKGWVYPRAGINNLDMKKKSLSPSCIPTTIPYHPACNLVAIPTAISWLLGWQTRLDDWYLRLKTKWNQVAVS